MLLVTLRGRFLPQSGELPRVCRREIAALGLSGLQKILRKNAHDSILKMESAA